MPRAEINDDAKNVSLLSADELTRMAQPGARNSHVRWRWVQQQQQQQWRQS